MSDKYYTHKLYPLQDKVLSEIININTFLYLTGGPVASRVYLNHRYSDDLDLFANNHPDFGEEVDRIANHLKKRFDLDLQVKEQMYARAFVNEGDTILKIDFVNDVGFHCGEIAPSTLYHRTDNWRNILSNKITSLSREEGKDAADILFICYHYSFDWFEIINEAKNKDSWVDEVNASKLISTFSHEKIEKVKWTQKQDYGRIFSDLKTIAKDILLGGNNSLVNRY
jgi:hypothetical protein